eukprot:6205830-Pleurochrysis_carterae.AAC.2
MQAEALRVLDYGERVPGRQHLAKLDSAGVSLSPTVKQLERRPLRVPKRWTRSYRSFAKMISNLVVH